MNPEELCWCGGVVVPSGDEQIPACSASPYHAWDNAQRNIGQPRKIYISGPMSGYPDCNFPAFNAAAARLREAGFEPVNPAENITGESYWDTIQGDLRLLLECDGVAVLSGWELSRGASVELHVAHVLEQDIRLLDEWFSATPRRLSLLIPRLGSSTSRGTPQ